MNALDQAESIFDQLVAWRRDFHKHPELGLETYRTAGIVAKTLRNFGYTVQEGIAKAGVVAVMENGEGPIVMNRVDMDALPIQEENAVPYISENPGRMHACGHDAHVAMGLGIASLMAEHRDAWRGTLKLIFQPGEEGQNGADVMIHEGALDDPRPEVALALHVWNHMPFGKIAAVPGPIMAAAEAFEVVITGRGGHGARPEDTVDPVMTAALMTTNLQTIISRNVAALETAVVSVCSIRAGEAFNVIPDSARLGGTVRTYDPKVREHVLQRLETIVQGTAKLMGAQARLDLKPLTPALVNDPKITALVQDVVVDLFGKETLDVNERTMGSEDASFFLQEMPGCYVFVGSGPEDYRDRPHHSPRFAIDERAMINGVSVIVESLRRLMPLGEV